MSFSDVLDDIKVPTAKGARKAAYWSAGLWLSAYI